MDRIRLRASGVLLGLTVAGLAACGGPAQVPSPSASAGGSPPRPSSFQVAATRAPADAGPGPQAPDPAPRAGDARVAGVPPFDPQRLRLPSGRSVSVRPEQTASDGSLAVPEDPSLTGWWSDGSRPGDPYGTTVLAGHIDSRTYGIGALAELTRARPGAAVVISSGTRSQAYRITSVTRVRKAELVPRTGAFDRTGAPRLVLITCGGRYDPATHHYADNVVVTAVPV